MDPVTIRDIDIPFGRLVAIILKFMIAAIPAMIVFYLIAFIVIALFLALVGGGAALLNRQAQPNLPSQWQPTILVPSR